MSHSDYGSDEDEYIYEDDVQYEEDNGTDVEEEDVEPQQNRRYSSGSAQVTKSPACADMRAELARSIAVPSDHVEILDSNEISPIMDGMVEDVGSLLDTNADVAQALLQLFKWDREKLTDAFFADPEKVLKNAGVDKWVEPPEKGGNSTGEPVNCKICYDDTVNVIGLGCGHQFCQPCYATFLATQVNDGPTCVIATCPEHKCTQLVTRSYYERILGERRQVPTTEANASSGSTSPRHGSFKAAKLVDVYRSYVRRNFVETCKNMKYCPAAGCEKVAVGSGVTTVHCTCGHPFCMRCGEEAHDPCSCAQLTEWQEKCMNESETANWILANTRKCPNCQSRIEKNQGCNHMTCRQCRHEFCWICMGGWAEHGQQTGGFYKCNRFMPTEVKSIISAVDKAKADLDRYLHYYQRYHGHETALKYAAAQRSQAEARMIEQQEAQKASWIDVQFLKQAAEQVINCRRVLKYTYVLGFSLRDNSAEKQLFEHHQEMLEKNTERLQEYTELNLDQIDRTQVVNLTRVTEKFMSSLLASMTGGVVSLDSDLSTIGMGGSSSSAGLKMGSPAGALTTVSSAAKAEAK